MFPNVKPTSWKATFTINIYLNRLRYCTMYLHHADEYSWNNDSDPIFFFFRHSSLLRPKWIIPNISDGASSPDSGCGRDLTMWTKFWQSNKSKLVQGNIRTLSCFQPVRIWYLHCIVAAEIHFWLSAIVGCTTNHSCVEDMRKNGDCEVYSIEEVWSRWTCKRGLENEWTRKQIGSIWPIRSSWRREKEIFYDVDVNLKSQSRWQF